MGTLKKYRLFLEREKGKQQAVSESIKEKEQEIKTIKKRIRNISTAIPIVQTVAQQTQEELKYQISELVTLALQAVFEDPYEFNIDFVLKRNKTEAELSFMQKGEKIDPMTGSGGGVLDIAGFALRITLWNLHRPKLDNMLILDEPFKHLKGIDDNIRAIQMVKELSDKLKLQIIMISDERVSLSEIDKGADKIFQVTNKKGVAQVKEI